MHEPRSKNASGILEYIENTSYHIRKNLNPKIEIFIERQTGFEPATPTLARSYSTN